MNINQFWPIDYAAEMCNIKRAALLRMDRDGLINLVPHKSLLWVKVEELRRVAEAADDHPALLYCTCLATCTCAE
jgi:hypothetical protein